MKTKSKIDKYIKSQYTLKNAIVNGNWATHISLVVMGFGNLVHKQFVKGLIFLASEIAFIVFMINTGMKTILALGGLGSQEQIKTWNEDLGVFEYIQGDNSQLILLYGICAVSLVILFIILWISSVKSAYKSECLTKQGKKVPSFIDDIKSLFDDNLHKLLMTPPLIGILAFTVLPLIFMISMAFTNYSKENDHLILFDWVGLENFKRVINFSGKLGKNFWSVLGWTIIWAICATFLNYILGIILALVINRKGTRLKKFWRSCFTLSIAVPQFVSLLIIRSMLQPQGAVNVLLKNAGIIDSSLPFFTDATWSRLTVIIINLWIGISFTLIQMTGILQNIPKELYESAKVDGAGPVTVFFKITMPYMIFVTTPYLITAFTANVNNFNVIYLLSKGDPVPVGSSAGKTDLLITWLYKLTIDQQYYNIGAVIGIFTFIVLAVVSFITYSRSKSFTNEEAFR